MINMKDLIKKQNDMIRKETGMVKKESINERLKRFKVYVSGESEPLVLMGKNEKDVKETAHQMIQNSSIKIKKVVKESKLNEVDFSKIKLPSQVNRFLNKFVDSMKDANLNRMKRASILYKVINASGMSVQQLMADIQKIKKELK
tara:strand:- start:44 stop:478 length:435 start_codon:yes stop_codon:yes gene_type:complete